MVKSTYSKIHIPPASWGQRLEYSLLYEQMIQLVKLARKEFFAVGFLVEQEYWMAKSILVQIAPIFYRG